MAGNSLKGNTQGARETATNTAGPEPDPKPGSSQSPGATERIFYTADQGEPPPSLSPSHTRESVFVCTLTQKEIELPLQERKTQTAWFVPS